MRTKLYFRLGIYAIGMLLLLSCSSFRKGTLQLDRGNYEAAILSFQDELSENPDHIQARQQIGFAYLKSGQLDHAIQEFNRVLKIKPDDPFALYYLGLAYLQNGQRSGAIETWRSYQNPTNPLVEQAIKRHLTLLEMVECLNLAHQALAEEEKLGALPPKSGTVAVFYFKDISPDNRFLHLQKAMAALIITDLSQVKSLQVLERVRVQVLLAEMQLSKTGIVKEKTAQRAGRLLGAEKLIVGTMEPGSMAVKTSVASTTQKEVIGAFTATAEMEEFYTLEKEIVYNTLKVLAVPFTSEEEKRFRKYHTKNLKAVIYFGQGLEALDFGKWEAAKSFFIKAVEEDPEFELAGEYRDGCPAATAPSLAALIALPAGTLSLASLNTTLADDLGRDIEEAVTDAQAEQEDILQSMTASFGDYPAEIGSDEPDALDVPPAPTGGVTIRW